MEPLCGPICNNRELKQTWYLVSLIVYLIHGIGYFVLLFVAQRSYSQKGNEQTAGCHHHLSRTPANLHDTTELVSLRSLGL